jgi:serine/threonine protein kinase
METLLGEGSFGCVITPPVQCTGEKQRIAKTKPSAKARLAGKIFVDKHDFSTEVRLSKKIAKIDPEGDNLLVPIESCTTNVNNALKNTATWHCGVVQNINSYKHSDTLYQLIMPYGGERLDRFVKQQKMSQKGFLDTVIPIAEALVMLKEHKYCHQDIKSSNILVKHDGKAILIDFSLMMPFSKVFTKENASRIKHTYFPYPPEFKVYMMTILRGANDPTAIISHVEENISHFGETRHQIYSKYVSPSRFKKQMKDFIKWIHKHPSLYEDMAEKIDVYSLGTVFIDNDQHLHTKGLSSRFKKGYKSLVQSMISPDPRTRCTPNELLEKMLALKNI